jgi:hypothetical protein
MFECHPTSPSRVNSLVFAVLLVVASSAVAANLDPVAVRAAAQVKLHYTPTYSSWLNQVELWFSKVQCDLIARWVFTSVPDLSRKLLR